MNTPASGISLQAAQSPMPRKRILVAYFNEAKFEFIGAVRTMAFAIPFLVLPLLVYLLFGVVIAADSVAKDPGLANYLFCGFSTFAVTGPAIFGVGCGVAIERDAGLLKLKRAMPMPSGAYLLAKMLMAMLFAAISFISLLVIGLIAGKLTMSVSQLVAVGAVMIIGVLPFCAIGVFIGAYFSGSVAPAIANLIYLPMLWLGGLFIPLPKFLQAQTVIWPSFHLNQIATGVAGLGKEFHRVPSTLSLAVLAGVTVLFGVLAIRKLARKG
jgi:ABC-2 type transport system permease protein